MNSRPKLIRITTVPLSLHKLIPGQMAWMKSKGFEVYMVSSPGPEAALVEKNEGCPFITIPMSRRITPLQDLGSLFRLYFLFRKLQPDIVHTHTPKAGLLGMLAAWMARVPVRIHTIAGLPWSEKKGLLRMLLKGMERITIMASHRILVNSKGMLDFLHKEKLANDPAVFSMLGKGSSNGIDTEYYARKQVSTVQITSLRSELEVQGFVWLFVGRLVGDKGIRELLAAFVKLKQDFPHDLLWLVGEHEERDSLSVEIKQQIAEDPSIVHFGWQDDVRPYLAAADCLVFPSYREGFPNVPLQAAAMECPMILSDINGCNEIVEDSIHGLLVEPKSVSSLLRAMSELRVDADRAKVFSANARAKVVYDFDRKKIWEALSAEYLR